jgi:hypothetical protein
MKKKFGNFWVPKKWRSKFCTVTAPLNENLFFYYHIVYLPRQFVDDFIQAKKSVSTLFETPDLRIRDRSKNFALLQIQLHNTDIFNGCNLPKALNISEEFFRHRM